MIDIFSATFDYADGSSFTLSGDKIVLNQEVQIPNYSAQIVFDGENKVKSFISFKYSSGARIIKSSLVLKIKEKYEKAFLHSFLDSQITKISDMKDEISNSYYCALFSGNGVGYTFLNEIPSKFKSAIIFKKVEDSIEVVLTTDIPRTFECDFKTETINIISDIPYTEALKNIAEEKAADKEWEDVIGWGSWDYYFNSIDEQAVRENVDFIAMDDVLSKKIKYIAIDDGWQQEWGDWYEGGRFRSGLQKTASYIKEKGFVPGIWIAPFVVKPLCGTVKRRNAFLVKNEYGDPLEYAFEYILDPTHPEGEKYIREVFTYLKESGFEYFKMDFLNNILNAERFYDKTAGHFDVLHHLTKIVRECVGEESHIMGCSLPYGYGTEDYNSRRTSLDIHNTWGHVKKCFEIYYPQFASHRKIYQNDLDYLIVRGMDTSKEKETNVLNSYKNERKAKSKGGFIWRDGDDFNYEEAKFWCAILLMSGSTIMLSDRLSMLNEKGLSLIKKTVLSADFNCAEPIGDVSTIPEVWYKKQNGAYYILNFNEEKKEYIINVSDSNKYYDIFENTEYRAEHGKLKLKVKGHHSLALYRK